MAQSRAEKESNDAKVEAETRIAQTNNELEIKKAELKRKADTAKAEADAAYEIQKQEQRKTIETATVNASIAKMEREAELKEKEVAVVEQTLAAEIRKKAESDRYAVEQAASADLAREKAKAEAAKYSMEQESAGIRAKGQAEADAIRARSLAEAEGMEKKAEAYAKYNNAAIAEMVVQVLPEMAANIAQPLSQIDKISIIGGSGSESNGVDTLADNVPSVMAKLFETMKMTTGVDLTEILKADTYDAKVNKNINVTGLSNTEAGKEVAGHIIADEIQSPNE